MNVAPSREHEDVQAERCTKVDQVKRCALRTHDFQVGDELTPTLKMKRRVVVGKYAAQIDSRYAT